MSDRGGSRIREPVSSPDTRPIRPGMTAPVPPPLPANPTNHRHVDLVVIGGGPAGMAAAVEARKQGVEDILILEREPALGGILNQCIHDGFGLEIFREALTGPEYMRRYILEVQELRIPYLTDCMVLELTTERRIIASTPDGLQVVQAGAVILAMGCRERSRGAIRIPGTRPAGIYTAGTAQHFINLKDLMVGKRIVILGSGDIGMIMARRLTLEGAKVLAVVEILPYSSGLTRNVVQCLEDYDIPLLLSHTVTNIMGKERVEAVEISKVDEDLSPIPGTEQMIECDTLLLSVGLIPENELSGTASIELDPVTKGAVVDQDLQTSVQGIFACGNVLHVHDVVDWASLEAVQAGRSAARFLSASPSTVPVPFSTSSSIPSPPPSSSPSSDSSERAIPPSTKSSTEPPPSSAIPSHPTSPHPPLSFSPLQSGSPPTSPPSPPPPSASPSTEQAIPHAAPSSSSFIPASALSPPTPTLPTTTSVPTPSSIHVPTTAPPPSPPPLTIHIPIMAGKGIHYIVPQKLSRTGLNDELILSFRVRNPDRDTTIELVTSTGIAVMEKTFNRVNPAEMIQFTLEPGTLAKITEAESLEIRIRDGGSKE